MASTPLGFLICYNISKKIITLIESLWCALQDDVYLMGPVTSPKMVVILAAILDKNVYPAYVYFQYGSG